MKKLSLLLFTLITLFGLSACNKQQAKKPSQEVAPVEVVQGDVQEIILSHNGFETIPRTTTVKAGKDYMVNITPESDGKGCMSTIKWKGTTASDAKVIKQGKTINFSLPKAQPGVYELVCHGMGMKQGEIIVEA